MPLRESHIQGMPTNDSGTRTVKSVDKLFTILEALVALDGARVTELADHLGLSKSTIHGYLATMHRRGYVVKEGDEYRLGLRFLEMGDTVQNSRQCFRSAKPQVKQLAAQTDERANFIVEEHGKGIFVHRETGEHAVETDTHLGKRIYLHATGAGKAILAFMPDRDVDDVVARHGLVRRTENTITDRERLEEELAAVRERGYAFNDEEGTKGLRSVGVPVKGPDERVIGAISVSGPSHRLRGDYFREELPNLILGCVNELELRLAYEG